MLTSHSVQGATKNRRALLRVFHLVQDESIRLENGRLWGGVWAQLASSLGRFCF
jgi:hypothetical protein